MWHCHTNVAAQLMETAIQRVDTVTWRFAADAVIYLCIFNGVDWLIGSVLSAKLDRQSSGSGLDEQNCLVPYVSRRRMERT